MDSTCIEKNTVSGIRLIGQKYQAKLVSEPAKLLGAWRRCLHASADSRTGADTITIITVVMWLFEVADEGATENFYATLTSRTRFV